MRSILGSITSYGGVLCVAATVTVAASFGCALGKGGITPTERAKILRRFQQTSVPTNPVARGGQKPADLLATAARGNKYVDDLKVARLGQLLFFYDGFTAQDRPGVTKTSCASCHDPKQNFSDGKALSVGAAGKQLERRSPSIRTAAHRSFLFWDGRADSLWSQALAPFENLLEIRSNRTRVARTTATDPRLARAYEEAFGEKLPAWLADSKAPMDAMPRPLNREQVDENIKADVDKGDPKDLSKVEPLEEQFTKAADPTENETIDASWVAAWEAMPDRHADINLVFVRVGKAIEAYEMQLAAGGSRFDTAMVAIAARDTEWLDDVMPADAQRGLRLFVGKAGCVRCHQGPDLTDEQFHYLGLPPVETPEGKPEGPKLDDTMWSRGAVTLWSSDFRCDGKFGDGCGRGPRKRLKGVRILATQSVPQRFVRGRVRTASLRDTARNTHWMHGGHFSSLERVVDFYDTPPKNPEVSKRQRAHSKVTSESPDRRRDAADKKSETAMVKFRGRDFRMGVLSGKAVNLDDRERRDLIAFLGTLTSAPVDPSLLDPNAGGFAEAPAPATATPTTDSSTGEESAATREPAAQPAAIGTTTAPDASVAGPR